MTSYLKVVHLLYPGIPKPRNVFLLLGLLRFPPRMKQLVDFIAGPLPTIYWELREWEEVPADWKLISVTSIYKKSRREDLGNMLV